MPEATLGMGTERESPVMLRAFTHSEGGHFNIPFEAIKLTMRRERGWWTSFSGYSSYSVDS